MNIFFDSFGINLPEMKWFFHIILYFLLQGSDEVFKYFCSKCPNFCRYVLSAERTFSFDQYAQTSWKNVSTIAIQTKKDKIQMSWSFWTHIFQKWRPQYSIDVFPSVFETHATVDRNRSIFHDFDAIFGRWPTLANVYELTVWSMRSILVVYVTLCSKLC